MNAIEEHMRSISDRELLEYTRSKTFSFSPETIQGALNELARRGIDPEKPEQLVENSENAFGNEPEVAADEFVGIDGWLILPAIGLVFRVFFIPIILLLQLAKLKEANVAYSVGATIIWAGLYIYLWVAIVRFFKKKSTAPWTMIRYMVASLFVSFGVHGLVICVGNGNEALNKSIIFQTFFFLFMALITGIWVQYFRVSKRVKATFVN